MAIVSANGAATPLSPNYVINSAFDINQRGFSSSTTSTYGFDRWVNNTDGTGATFTAQTFPLGAAPVQGQESKNFLQVATTGQTASGTFTIFTQRLEDVRTFAGQIVTLSFWAKAASGTPKIAVELNQGFGSGGSSDVSTSAGLITLSTSWVRYTVTIACPIISGKTIGTSSYLELNLWTSAGSTYSASRASSIGIQSATIAIWGVQLEAGSIATPFRRNANSLQGELAACQRYYYRQGNSAYTCYGNGFGETTGVVGVIVKLPVPLRVGPISIEHSGLAVFDGVTVTGSLTSVGFIASNSSPDTVYVQATKSGSFTQYRPYMLLNNNNSSSFFAVSAEL